VGFDLLGEGSGVLVWVGITGTVVSTAASFIDLAGDASGAIDSVAVSLDGEAKKYTTAKNNSTTAAANWRADMTTPSAANSNAFCVNELSLVWPKSAKCPKRSNPHLPR
jgi:hypothetical protein